MKRRLGLALVFVTLAAIAVGVAGCAPEKQEAKKEGKAERPATRVETVRLERTAFDEVIELNGVTEPVRQASVVPEIPGRIVRLDVVEGESVEEGADVLVVDTSSQRARIDSIRVQIKQLDRDIERTGRLVEKGLATQAGLEQMESQRSSLQKSVREVQVGTRQARTKTPIGGIVTKKMAEPGEFASPGVPVARIVDIATIVVRVGLPERDIPFVQPNQRVSVRIEATGEVLAGTLEVIGIEANPKNRTFPLEIHVPNPDTKLRAGMRATVSIVKRRMENVVMIPRDAVLQAVGGEEVFVVEQDVARVRKVQIGTGFAHFVLVTSGLSRGEELVVRGHRAIVHEEPVQIATSEPCCAAQVLAYNNTSGTSLAQAGPLAAHEDGASETPGEQHEPPDVKPSGGGQSEKAAPNRRATSVSTFGATPSALKRR